MLDNKSCMLEREKKRFVNKREKKKLGEWDMYRRLVLFGMHSIKLIHNFH